jgi:quinol monooxygenase YgiN
VEKESWYVCAWRIHSFFVRRVIWTITRRRRLGPQPQLLIITLQGRAVELCQQNEPMAWTRIFILGPRLARARAMADRCRAVQQEPGCQQFEVFQSALDPDKLVVLELWADQAALDVHAQLNATRPPNPALAELRADGVRPREDYVYNRTR